MKKIENNKRQGPKGEKKKDRYSAEIQSSTRLGARGEGKVPRQWKEHTRRKSVWGRPYSALGTIHVGGGMKGFVGLLGGWVWVVGFVGVGDGGGKSSKGKGEEDHKKWKTCK